MPDDNGAAARELFTRHAEGWRKQSMRERGVPITGRKNQTPENDAKALTAKWLNERSVWWFRVNNLPVQYGDVKLPVHTKGISDIIAVLPGHGGVFIELKRFDGKGRQSDDQKTFQANVEANGGKYFLIESLDDLERHITPLLCSSPRSGT